MIPKDEIYMPPMCIKIIDHRNFGRKPIVGMHVIKSLNHYRVDRNTEELMFTNTIENEITIINMESSGASDDQSLEANKEEVSFSKGKIYF
jgi:hypothetical protein